MKEFILKHKDDILVFSLVLLIIALFHLFFINAEIPSGSMENIIYPKDRIIGTKYTKDYQRGDVVIFKYDEEEYYIKRIIGVPGDTVELIGSDVYVNGKKLDEPYIKETAYYENETYEVPENSYFFLGDNRNDSADSRYWDNPFRTNEDIVAKAAFRYWPIWKFKFID